ncbi:MAG: arylsulfatase [Verrucomicrobia bacterium]|nr:arylsulfatase [Verrucomicrobiota bacterium]
MKFFHSQILFNVFVVTWASFAPAAEPIKLQITEMLRKPNVVFILADDLGYGDLGCYGQKKIKTPNLDRLAAEGIRFTQCYAGSTVCAPSRCSLMTGRHTGHAWIRGNGTQALRSNDVTVAEVLRQAGYRTGAFGKWGLGLEDSDGTPNKKGFEEWLGYLDQTLAHNYYPTQLWRNENRLLFEKNLNDKKGEYSHELFERAATNFITLNTNRPFFLYLPVTLPHANNELGTNGMEIPSDAPYSSEPWPQPEKNKAAMITRLDETVGRILAHLQRLKLDENTIVFFTSDNGPHREGGVDETFFRSGGALRGLKRDLYEGGIRVPMIVRWPGRIKPGGVSDQIWAFWDFLPTAAELAGASAPTDIDGLSMLPAILGKKQKSHESLYWEFHEQGFKQAVRAGDWKAVRLAPDQSLELYNLKTDRGETNNLAAKRPAVVRKMDQLLREARVDSKEWPIKPPPPRP